MYKIGQIIKGHITKDEGKELIIVAIYTTQKWIDLELFDKDTGEKYGLRVKNTEVSLNN